VEETNRSLCDLPPLVIGSKPIDDGNYIFTDEEREEFLAKEPGAERYMRPFIGATEFLYNERRWILTLADVSPNELRSMPAVMERVTAVRQFRLRSKSAPTRALAGTPTRFHVNVVPDTPFLVIPKVSSERREYVPIAWLEPPAVPSDLVFVLRGASLWQFSVLTSRMQMAWLRNIGGRLKSDYRYSVGVVYNPFPWPTLNERQRTQLGMLAQRVLVARAQYPGASLADLYDVDAMPAELVRAHKAVDTAVDRLYRRAAFGSDRERVEHLFALYERLLTPPIAPEPEPQPPPIRRALRRQRVRLT
jgi:hypothetical protein